MRRYIGRICAIAAIGVALSTVGAAGANASGTAFRAFRAAGVSAAGTSPAAASPGTQLWLKHYHESADFTDVAYSMAVSPDGGTVFVTGEGQGVLSGGDYATVAYNATTGAQLWAKTYNGPGGSLDIAYSVAVSPTGKTVFVTGRADNKTDGRRRK
jgi:DNA-binding beta-propeller fold protein YncE